MPIQLIFADWWKINDILKKIKEKNEITYNFLGYVNLPNRSEIMHFINIQTFINFQMMFSFWTMLHASNVLSPTKSRIKFFFSHFTFPFLLFYFFCKNIKASKSFQYSAMMSCSNFVIDQKIPVITIVSEKRTSYIKYG